jgi:hypothetical protein
LFAEFEADRREASIDDIVVEQKKLAKERLVEMMGGAGSLPFIDVADTFMEEFMLRENNVKDVCVELAREGKIENRWGGGARKPKDQTQITLTKP